MSLTLPPRQLELKVGEVNADGVFKVGHFLNFDSHPKMVGTIKVYTHIVSIEVE